MNREHHCCRRRSSPAAVAEFQRWAYPRRMECSRLQRFGQTPTGRKVGRAAAVLAASCLIAFAAAADQNEPTYQGRSLTDWTREFDPHEIVPVGREPPAWIAIRHVGTNAIPTLLQWIAEKDPPEPPKPHLSPCYTMTRSERAKMAFFILGETAKPAIPKLTELTLTHSDPKRSDMCINALADIGSASLPSFKIILSQATSGRRCSAMDFLPAVHTNCISLLPALVECLVGEDNDVGWKAASTIGGFGIPESSLVPALTNALPTASAAARARVFRCLFWLNFPAREAMPAIRAGLCDTNSEVRTNAIYAAQRIAPELLDNGEPKTAGSNSMHTGERR